jgi:hypothetical protein
MGQSQLYGTQFHSIDGGPLVMFAVDPAITDQERAKWGVPSLAQTQRMLDRMNAPHSRDY